MINHATYFSVFLFAWSFLVLFAALQRRLKSHLFAFHSSLFLCLSPSSHMLSDRVAYFLPLYTTTLSLFSSCHCGSQLHVHANPNKHLLYFSSSWPEISPHISHSEDSLTCVGLATLIFWFSFPRLLFCTSFVSLYQTAFFYIPRVSSGWDWFPFSVISDYILVFHPVINKPQLCLICDPNMWEAVGCFLICATPTVSLHSFIHLPTEPLCSPPSFLSIPLSVCTTQHHIWAVAFFSLPPTSTHTY